MIEFITSLIFLIIFLLIMGFQIKRQMGRTKKGSPSERESISPPQKEELFDEFFEPLDEEGGDFGPLEGSDQCPNCRQSSVRLKIEKTPSTTIHNLECKKCGWKEVY